jgi:hypothetical protein
LDGNRDTALFAATDTLDNVVANEVVCTVLETHLQQDFFGFLGFLISRHPFWKA